MAISMDNASANDVMMRNINCLLSKRYSLDLKDNDCQVRCLAHVVSLIVQSGLSALKEADNPDIYDYYEKIHRKDPIHYDDEAENPEEEEEEGVGDGEEAAAQTEDTEEAAEREIEEMAELLRTSRVEDSRDEASTSHRKFTPLQKVCMV